MSLEVYGVSVHERSRLCDLMITSMYSPLSHKNWRICIQSSQYKKSGFLTRSNGVNNLKVGSWRQ